jgi:hypothetical protein
MRKSAYYCAARCTEGKRFLLWADEAAGHYVACRMSWPKGRRFPKEIQCPWCGESAFHEFSREGKKLWAMWGSFADKEEQARWLALETPQLDAILHPEPVMDPARIYLLARGQAVDVTARFRSAV